MAAIAAAITNVERDFIGSLPGSFFTKHAAISLAECHRSAIAASVGRRLLPLFKNW
jgi:hypothetical protein